MEADHVHAGHQLSDGELLNVQLLSIPLGHLHLRHRAITYFTPLPC